MIADRGRWLAELRASAALATADSFVVDGVPLELPVPNDRSTSRQRDWQRRVLPDLIPDSVNADAPERTPFRILYSFTTNQATRHLHREALRGRLEPLKPLFVAETVGRREIPLAFHVLAVRSVPRGEADARGFTERTFLLLCRRADGTLDVDLVRRLIERLRSDPRTLDLAQRTVLDALEPGWTPDREPRFALEDGERVIPFDPSAGRLFQEDLDRLLRARLSPADFFQALNLLLMLHLGLYQGRVAALLNPTMDLLLREMAGSSPENLRALERFSAEAARRHPFAGSLSCRAPDAGALRPVSLQTPERMAFERLSVSLNRFHFNVILLAQVRRLGEFYLRRRWEDPSEEVIREALRTPLEIVRRMQEDEDFATYLHRATLALAVRYVHQQISEVSQEDAFRRIENAESGLHAMQTLYEMYNRQTSRNAAGSRAYRTGVGVTSSLLKQNQYGLVQGRNRVGPFFELGANLLPLLLLVAIGPENEKAPVSRFLRRLEDYGLALDAAEQESLLQRLKAMGVFERFSDAGESAYVRNLMTSLEEGAP